MAKLTVSGLATLDGEYEFDEAYFTNGELHTIKQVSGVRAGELMDAMEAGDNDILVAIAKIVLERNGRKVSVEALWAAEVGKLAFEWGSEADAEVPPKVTPLPEDELTSNGGNSLRSGSNSEASGEPSQSPPRAIGLAG